MYIVLLLIVVCFVVSICNIFLLKTDSIGNIKEFIAMCAVQILLEISFGTLILSVSLVLRKLIGILIASIIYIAFIQTLIYQAINLVVNKIIDFETEFDIGKYLIYGNIERINMGSSFEDMLRAGIVAIIFFTISMLVGYFSLTKKDTV